MEWWQGSLFYEIFPASYQDSRGTEGIGDIRGITTRLDYLKDLGVKGVRLNSIFRSQHYPEHYTSVTSLVDIDDNLGTQKDFDALVANLHSRNMTLILDIPMYPFVKSLTGGLLRRFRSEENESSLVREKRENEEISNFVNKPSTVLSEILSTIPSISEETISSIVDIPSILDAKQERYVSSNYVNPDRDEHVVTTAIKFWVSKGVDGFYLKGLKHYVNDTNFVQLLNDWKIVTGSNRIIICDWDTLKNIQDDKKRNTLLEVVDLVDVHLRLSNGTKDIKAQIDEMLTGSLFTQTNDVRPWIHWSIGGVDSPRVTSTLKVHNASIAVTLLGMMLPGTPNIFYGDEVSSGNLENKKKKTLRLLLSRHVCYYRKVTRTKKKLS